MKQPAQFTVTNDVPLPPSSRNSYPLGEMEIGDSFPVPVVHKQNVSEAVSKYARLHPEKGFTVRKHDGAYRCWRIK